MNAANKARAARPRGRAPASAQRRTRRRSARVAIELPASDSLARYMNDLHALPLLDACEERELAKQIEALELAHWSALLSYRPALEVVASAVAPLLDGRAQALERLRGKAGTSLAPAARQLRALDPSRAALRAADAAVLASFEHYAAARAFLGRVERARAREQAAKQRFVAANLRLVIAMARRYTRSLLPLADLIQEGNIGLMRAVERFDYRRGLRFSTYGAWWIRHHVNRALADRGRLVRIPVHALDDMKRIARARDKQGLMTGDATSGPELARELGMSADKIEAMRLDGLVTRAASLDRVMGEDGDRTMHDVLAAPDAADPVEQIELSRWAERVRGLLPTLPGHEAMILRNRFGLDGAEGLTLREIREKLDLSRERIRQLERDALERLRGALAA